MRFVDRISERYQFFETLGEIAICVTSSHLCNLIQKSTFLFFEYITFSVLMIVCAD